MITVKWDRMIPTVTTREMKRKSMSKNQYIRKVLNDMRLAVQELRSNGMSLGRATWQMAKEQIAKQDKVEHYGNSFFFASVDKQHYTPIEEGGKKDMTNFVYIAFHSNDKQTDGEIGCGWQMKQWIKNDICGDDWEGVELFPAEYRMMNTANEYHLFCYPFELPIGHDDNNGKPTISDCKDGGIGRGARQTLQIRSDEL